MEPIKSLDEIKLITALISDVSNVCGDVFNTRALRLTIKKVERRASLEGLGFLTKTLPKLGKALDKCLAGACDLNCTELGFKPLPGTKLPRFLGELFSRVLDSNGKPLRLPDINCVKVIRQICYLFYKYELPYTDVQEQQVTQKFERTESDLSSLQDSLPSQDGIAACVAANPMCSRLQNRDHGCGQNPHPMGDLPHCRIAVTRKAKQILNDLFAFFDPTRIHPRHGPGAVSTREQLGAKYLWTNVSSRITDVYPYDAYFCASNGHVCDTYTSFAEVTEKSNSARVILVPKDSRGPRLISCEPVDFQWVQQGLGRAIVELVESSRVTKTQVNFTHQTPNRIAALYGSENGRYATLDLNEASDRVSLALVRLLFPDTLVRYLEACRTTSTVLPDGRVLELAKFAPMGSCLCFPILALTVFAILAAGAPDAYTRERILVYGDDVIVPTAYAADAIELLESFGLKINRDKSCIRGFFRESCGMDAFHGVDVTPVRIRTVWSSHDNSADVYSSWIAYANSLWDRRYYLAYDYIVGCLLSEFGSIPDCSMGLSAPSLRSVPDNYTARIRKRWNKDLQKVEFKVKDVASPAIIQQLDGWSMLLRYFCEAGTDYPLSAAQVDSYRPPSPLQESASFSVSRYTERRASYLALRWR